MENLYLTVIFLFTLFFLLGSGVWIGLALMGVAYVGMELFTVRPAGVKINWVRIVAHMIAGIFAASLELTKEGILSVSQKKNFDKLFVKKT